jgi:protoporphyrinogen oxidase
MPRVAIIGAGFSGLAAAYELVRRNHEVHVFERSKVPGGLASGFKAPNWQWSLERHYHHIFTSDQDIISFVEKCGASESLKFYHAKTSSLYNGQQFRLDSAAALLRCPVLSWAAKLRTGAIIGFLKTTRNWRELETQTAAQFLQKTMGHEAWKILWEPLFEGKFGRYHKDVNAAWFWARIHCRSPQLGYFEGGFGVLAEQLVAYLQKMGVTFHFNFSIDELLPNADGLCVKGEMGRVELLMDRAILTVPLAAVKKILGSGTLPNGAFHKVPGLAAQTLILELDEPFFNDGTYWLNVNESDWPFLAVVEHTNLADKKYYGGKHILYVGKYLEPSSDLYSLDVEGLLAVYAPFLDKLRPGFRKTILNKWLFRDDYAQPVATVNHSASLPPVEILPGKVYWVSMQHVYPWDRGTNFAVRHAQKTVHEYFPPN